MRGAIHRPRRRFSGVCDRRAGARCDQCKCRGCGIIPCRLPSECPGAARSVTAAPRHSTRRLLRRALHLAIELGAQYDRGDRKRCALPDALALAGFDNERWTELVEPGITVLEQPVEEMGRAAMSMLLERLRTPELPVRRLVMTGRCVARGSTAGR